MTRPIDHPRRCSAHSARTGAPCRKWALVGGRVCRTHGGGAPQVKRTAAQRIAMLAEGPAVSALERALKSGDWGATVRAARDLLDRAGIGVREQGFSAAQVHTMGRRMTECFLRWTPDAANRAACARELRMILGDETVDAAVAALPTAEVASYVDITL